MKSFSYFEYTVIFVHSVAQTQQWVKDGEGGAKAVKLIALLCAFHYLQSTLLISHGYHI
jgi:hypothetical protein